MSESQSSTSQLGSEHGYASHMGQPQRQNSLSATAPSYGDGDPAPQSLTEETSKITGESMSGDTSDAGNGSSFSCVVHKFE